MPVLRVVPPQSAVFDVDAPQPPVAGASPVPRSPIVLVVDDDSDVGEATAKALRREGMRVRTAVTTEYASDFCKAQPFDAVVLDHDLADRYTEEFLDQAPEMGLAVIVPESTSDLLADVHRSYGAREFAVLVKPVVAADLVEAVQETITESHRLSNRPSAGVSAPRLPWNT